MTISPATIGLFWLAVILGITAGFFVLVRKLGERRESRGKNANQMLAEFRSLRDRGGISDKEYEHIRSKLGPQVQLEASEATSASTMADAAVAMREAAQALAVGLDDGSGTRSERNEHNTEDDGNTEGDRAAGEGCDTPPPASGDSTERGR